jgi:hypothetical protein
MMADEIELLVELLTDLNLEINGDYVPYYITCKRRTVGGSTSRSGCQNFFFDKRRIILDNSCVH